jgi:serine 3-dehydrogenase (NADP+)
MTRTVLITGATSGIGRAAARRFARGGWNVIGLGRRADRLSELRAELQGRVAVLAADVRDLAGVEAALAALPDPFREIDLLVNNAGTTTKTLIQDAGLDELDAIIDTNVKAVVGLTRLLLPVLIRRKGAIINVSSAAANYPHARSVVYGGSKAFLSHFSMGLRSDLHGTGVRVTAVEPGRTTTEIVAETDYLQMAADDVAEAIFAIAELPAHINVNKLELMPVSQSLGGYQIDRQIGRRADSLPAR